MAIIPIGGLIRLGIGGSLPRSVWGCPRGCWQFLANYWRL